MNRTSCGAVGTTLHIRPAEAALEFSDKVAAPLSRLRFRLRLRLVMKRSVTGKRKKRRAPSHASALHMRGC